MITVEIRTAPLSEYQGRSFTARDKMVSAESSHVVGSTPLERQACSPREATVVPLWCSCHLTTHHLTAVLVFAR
jgi:hypothetical protein